MRKITAFLQGLGVMVLVVASMFVVCLAFYSTIEVRALRRLTSGAPVSAFESEFRKPDRIVRSVKELQPQGWTLPPDRPVANEIRVYTLITGLRIYVFTDANGAVEYLFTSGS